MLCDFSMINGEYIQYSRIFHTFPENNRTGYLPEKTHAVPTCRWGGVLPAVSGLEYSSLQRECTEFPYAIPPFVDTAIVQKEECFVECTKPPVLRKAKPGTHAQSIISLMKIKNPNPFPIGNKFGFFICGGDCWTRTSDLLRVKIRCAPENVAPQRFPALLRAFGSVGDPLCPPYVAQSFPRLGHGLGQPCDGAEMTTL